MGERAVVLGSGPIRIGQGIEFDYCSVRAALELRRAGVGSILINSNPETVSTDFDTSDRLYFEPLDLEHVLNILENEAGRHGSVPAVITQFGGQTAISLAGGLGACDVPLLGTSVESIDLAEDRHRFDRAHGEAGCTASAGGGGADGAGGAADGRTRSVIRCWCGPRMSWEVAPWRSSAPRKRWNAT